MLIIKQMFNRLISPEFIFAKKSSNQFYRPYNPYRAANQKGNFGTGTFKTGNFTKNAAICTAAPGDSATGWKIM